MVLFYYNVLSLVQYMCISIGRPGVPQCCIAGSPSMIGIEIGVLRLTTSGLVALNNMALLPFVFETTSLVLSCRHFALFCYTFVLPCIPSEVALRFAMRDTGCQVMYCTFALVWRRSCSYKTDNI